MPKDVTVSLRNADSTQTLTVGRLKARSDYLRVARSGKRWVTPCFVVQTSPATQEISRIGFTVTKKQGNAVIRNRIKRRLKEAAEQVMPLHAQTGQDYVLIGRTHAATAPFDELTRNLTWALKRLHGKDTTK